MASRYNPADKFNPGIDPLNDPNYLGYSRGVDIPKDLRPEGVEANRIQPIGAQVEGVKHVDRAGELAFRKQGLDYERQGVEASRDAAEKIIGSKISQVDIMSDDTERRMQTEKNIIGIKQAGLGLTSQAIGYEQSAAEAKAKGNMFASLVSVGDFVGKTAVSLVQDHIDARIHAVVDKERGEFTSSLESLEKNPTLMRKLSTPEDAEIPEELRSLDSKLDTLGSAYASGVIPKTLYLSRLNSSAKELRNQFPGMRDYIDAKFSRVSGVDPANAYMAAMVSNINRAQATAAARQKAVETFYKSNNHVPGIDGQWARFQKGEIGKDQFYAYVSKYNQFKEKFTLDKMTADNATMNRVESERVYTGLIQDFVKGEASHNFSSLNLAPDGRTAQQVLNVIQDHMSGKTPIDPRQAQQLGGLVEGLKLASIKRTMEWLNTPDPSIGSTEDGVTPAQRMGGDQQKLLKIVTDNHAVYDSIGKLITDKDIGPAFSLIKTLEVKRAQSDLSLLGDPSMGQAISTTSSINRLMPEFGAEHFKAMAGASLEIKNGEVLEYFKQQKEKILVGSTDLRNINNNSVSIQKSIDALKEKKINDPVTFRKFTDSIDDISNPKLKGHQQGDIARLRTINAFFDKDGRIQIYRFGEGGRDPNQPNKKIPGMWDLYSSLTKPQITKDIYELQRNYPEQDPWGKYTSFAKEAFATQLVPQELRNLSSYATDPNLRIVYNDGNKGTKTPSFTVEKIPNSTIRSGLELRQFESSFASAQSSVAKLNSAIANLSTIARTEGSDVNAFVLDTLITSNVDLNAIGNLPEYFANAVRISNQQKFEKERLEREREQRWNIK